MPKDTDYGRIETHGATTGNPAHKPTPPRDTPLDRALKFVGLKAKPSVNDAEAEMLPQARETEDEKKNK